jgi:signal transduction histidine kinase
MQGGLTRRVIIASALLTLLTGAAFAVLVLAISDLRSSARLSRHSQQILATSNEVERLLVDIETGVRGYLLTGQDEFLTPARAAEAGFDAASTELVNLTRDPEQNRTAREIKAKGEAYIRDYSRPLVEAASRGDPEARSVAKAEEGKALVDDLRREFTVLENDERRIAAGRDARSRENANQATIAAVSGLACLVVLVGFFATYLVRTVVRPVRQASAMAQELASGDLSTRMPTVGAAEIRVLQQALNTMAGSLERSQADLARLLAEQAALRRVATLVAQETSPEAVFQAVNEEVGRLLDVHGTRLMRYEADGTTTIVAGWGQPGIVPAGTRISLAGRNIGSMVRSTGRPARLGTYENATGAIAAVLREHGVHSAVGAPVTVEGRLWGAMYGFSISEQALPAGLELRLASFTDLVGTGIANAQARADLTASRARVVAATDNIRRRIERDLHDGTQQRLVSLSLDLRTAQAGVPEDQPELREELDSIANEMVAALDDLREISRGIHPSLLAKGGLAPALKSLARRSPVPVELDIAINGRFPEQVEVAVYYVVAEALTNAAKHARATAIQIGGGVDDGRIWMAVRDDGVGGADPANGSGLIGLTDRVEALGGTITVLSPPGEGTSLYVWLPLVTPDKVSDAPAR